VPTHGIAGAAWSTVVAQAWATILFAGIFVVRKGLDSEGLRLRWESMRHFLTLAAPQGLRVTTEILAWTIFMLYLGRLGTAELAASSIAFRINGLAFFPSLGLGQAVGILVGQARGAQQDDQVPGIVWQGLGIGMVWMIAMGALFWLFPQALISVFLETNTTSTVQELGVLILRFVAFYCLFDAMNVVLASALAAAGDTRWTLGMFVAASSVFLVSLVAIDLWAPSLAAEWGLATLFVCFTALAWLWRFHTGKWKRIRVIAPSQS
jgi:MATE family multidrug resistance protein